MTKFDKALFNTDGDVVTYGADRQFIARFKYKPGSKASFIAFLIKNFTVEEYFAARAQEGNTPMMILAAKGYIQPHIRRWIKAAGFPVTTEGYKQFLASQFQARKAA